MVHLTAQLLLFWLLPLALAFAAQELFLGAAENDIAYVVANLANDTVGGKKFAAHVGIRDTSHMLKSAHAFINSVFYDDPAIPRRPVSELHFSVDIDTSASGFAAYTSQASIHLSDKYVASYQGTPSDVAAEVEGIIYHESTHVWQWDGRGTAPRGLIEGIADYVRLTAHLAPRTWPPPGSGDKWDEGYRATAHFLQYCEGRKRGFVKYVNARLANSTWSLDFFRSYLGYSVDELWKTYRAAYS